jgi:hypothetical protein
MWLCRQCLELGVQAWRTAASRREEEEGGKYFRSRSSVRASVYVLPLAQTRAAVAIGDSKGRSFSTWESPRASHGGLRGSRMTKGVEGNETVAIWPEKNGPVLQQCTRGVPPRSYFAQQYLLAHGTCMGVSGGIVLL